MALWGVYCTIFRSVAVLILAGIFAWSFWIGLSGALMPGPLFASVVEESLNEGVKAGPLMSLGHAILELALVVALMLGLAPLFGYGLFRALVSGAGAALLLWMAFGIFRTLGSLSLSRELLAASGGASSRSSKGPLKLCVGGALLSLANPYWSVWWATVGVGLLLRSGSAGLPGVAAFYLGHVSSDFAWYSALSLGLGKGRGLLNDTAYRWIVGICGGALGLFGLLFAVYAVRCASGL